MNNVPPKNLKAFVITMSVIAIIVMSFLSGGNKRPEAERVVVASSPRTPAQNQTASPVERHDDQETQHRQEMQRLEERRQVEILAQQRYEHEKAEAATRHAKFLARYLNTGFTRKTGIQSLAIVSVTENGKINSTLSTALADHFKSSTVEPICLLFTPEFVSDGLFNHVFNGSTDVISKLEADKLVDGILLARQTVRYSKDASLENLITANMQLNLVLVSTTTRGQSKGWTFSAVGPGFTEQGARQTAEERLLKQITKDTKMSL